MEPQSRIGLASLTKLAFDGVDLHPLHTELLQRCLREENSEAALMDLSVIEQLCGNRDQGLVWQAKALARHRVYRTESRHPAKHRLLVFAEAGHMGANTPIEFLLQNSAFDIITYYPDLDGGHPKALPEHDVAFCAAPADSARAHGFYDTVRALSLLTGTEVLNRPESTVALDRDQLAQMFAYVDGLRFPRTRRLTRHDLTSALATGTDDTLLSRVGHYPIIIRPCGSHAGDGLARIHHREKLVSYLKRRKEQVFFLSEYVDYASPHDGSFRKYRVVFIDGKAYPCHMAIADQWDLWYLNADMHRSVIKRREEEAFMDGFDQGFAARHQNQLRALTDGIDLDYFGIDCAEDPEGNLVVFEADNALIVHDMDPETIFPYKRRHMHRIFSGFEEMLLRHCHPGDGSDAWQWGKTAGPAPRICA
ncbi:ATP-grasp domain-containing protein [Aliiroseovarius crassostreae]|uniref:ATP-grasp domain-containing protein n=1 Tax=Aliiroseovarius crassostreae TaxID=154981 RepID=UPI003C7CD1E0